MSLWTRRQPPCRRCTRLRRLVCVALLAASLPALPGTLGAQPNLPLPLQPVSLPPTSAAPKPDLPPGVPRVWLLTEKDIAELAALTDERHQAADKAAREGRILPVQTRDALKAILGPLQDREFPTEALLRHALQASHRAVADKGAAAKGRPPGEPLVGLYDELMTADLARKVVQKAEKERLLHKATPLALAPPASPASACLCRPVNTTEEAMGLLAYWHGAKEAQQVNFSLFSRITWLGAELEDNGAVHLAEPGGAPQPLAFVRAARQYGVKVDLGLHRRDWALLQGASDKRVDELAASAAAQTWKQLQTKLVDRTAWWQGFLIKGWRDPDWAFDGLTIFFEDTLESAEAKDRARYERFLYTFVRAVMQQMRRTGAADGTPAPSKGDAATAPRAERPYRLNIVVPDHLVLADDVFGLDRLWGVLQESERVLSQKQIDELRLSLVQDRTGKRPVQTDITVNFLVLLSDPTSDFKKLLRARLDGSRHIQGHDRVALLSCIVPVLLTRRDTTLPLGTGQDALRDDLAYARWTYGGVGLWPMPVEGVGQGSEVSKVMGETYGAEPRWSDRVCQWGCPWRVPLRLSMQALVLVGALLVSLYLWNSRVRALGRPVVLALLGGGFIIFLVGAALLTCDPLLQPLEPGSLLLAGGFLGALAFGLWRTRNRPG